METIRRKCGIPIALNAIDRSGQTENNRVPGRSRRRARRDRRPALFNDCLHLNITTRLMGLVLAAVAVQFGIHGVESVLPELASVLHVAPKNQVQVDGR